MQRVLIAILTAALLTIALTGAVAWSSRYRSESGGDAATDRLDGDPDDAPLRFTPVPIDQPAGHRGSRTSTDPALDTGAPARGDASWI